MSTAKPVEGSGRIFVLGAGASVFAGYPLASHLMSFVRDFNTLDHITRDVASRVLGKLDDAETQFRKKVVNDPNRNCNLEELLTYLELYHSFPGTIFALNPWDETDSGGIRRLITEKFLSHQYDLNGALSGTTTAHTSRIELAKIARICNAWSSYVKPGDTILTFNWDILHEIILWKAGLWSYRDGYGFICGKQGGAEENSKVVVLKLHGSVNWVQENPINPVREIADVASFFPKSKDWEQRDHHSQAQRDSGRKLVLPTYLKDISTNRVLLEVWTLAHSAISQAREIIVIGYSLNPVDHPARLLFGTALSKNGSTNKVTVVSPEVTAWGDFLLQIDRSMHRIPKRFEDWVCSLGNPGQ